MRWERRDERTMVCVPKRIGRVIGSTMEKCKCKRGRRPASRQPSGRWDGVVGVLGWLVGGDDGKCQCNPPVPSATALWQVGWGVGVSGRPWDDGKCKPSRGTASPSPPSARNAAVI